MKSFRIAFLITWFIFLFSPPFVEAQPEIQSITPSFGPPGTEVTVHGAGFQPGAKAALYGGGPYITGTVDTPGHACGVAVSGNYAYVADGTGLQVIDVSNPVLPTIVGSMATPWGHACGVAVSGNYAYVADGFSLQVIDITDPTSPTIEGTVDMPVFLYTTDVAVSGSYAYVASEEIGLQIIDISDPTLPTIKSSVDTMALSVVVSGSYAYVAGYDFHIIDISDPAIPTIVSSLATSGGHAYDVAVSGNYAYVTERSTYPTQWVGLHIIDISDPELPITMSSLQTKAYGVAVSGNYAYVTDNTGLQVIDVSNPVVPTIVGWTHPPSSYGSDVAVSDSYAYIVGGDFQVIDISYPSSATIVGSVDTSGLANDVAVSGSYAYVTHPTSEVDFVPWCGLQVIDINDPAAPTTVGSVHIKCSSFYGPNAYDVAVSGNYAYMVTRNNRLHESLQVIDISNPPSPALLGDPYPFGWWGVSISGNYAYTGDGHNLLIIDIGDPASLAIVGSIEMPCYGQALTVSGNYAFVSDGYILYIIDISNTVSPIIMGSVEVSEHTTDVAVSGNYAYVLGGFSLLHVIDISDLTTPIIVASVNGPRRLNGLDVSVGYVYIGGGMSGFYILATFEPLENLTRLDSQVLKAKIPAGQRPGTWDLYVTNPDGSHAVFHNGFTVTVDTDGDGVPDDQDECPLAGADGPCGGPVRADGCPANDVDGDEICNDQDKCPWAGDGRYGIKYGDNNLGCPLGDADGDTIPDIYDNCAWSGNVSGLGIRRGGCPIKDSDGDGIPNHLDHCAWQNPGDRWIKPGGCKAPASWNSAGLEDPDGDRIPSRSPTGQVLDECPWAGNEGLGIQRNGCPITDSDGDGMPNNEDACAWRGPTEEFGMTGEGCPIGDRDEDGVPDPEDICPDKPGERNNRGC
jgi:hypothetical protein